MALRNSPQRAFTAVALLLLGAGWAANHFASLLSVLKAEHGLSGVMVNGAYGIYALGLLPCLLGGGVLADRIGARPVVITGGLVAALGNLSLLLWNTGAGLLTGRFIVGLGVGLAMSAGTAWAGRLRGPGGATLAGVFLTLGFAAGPVISGLLAFLLPTTMTLTLPFALSCLFSLFTAFLVGIVGRSVPGATGSGAASAGKAKSGGGATAAPQAPERSATRALRFALPVGIWVFSTGTTAFVVLASRVAEHVDSGVLLPGIAAILTFSAGLVVQILGRRFGWGPRAGIGGILLASAGLALAGAGGAAPPLWIFGLASVVLGSAYGLCLQQGLLDIGRLAAPERQGTVIGIFYVVTYLGFGLPVLLEAVQPTLGAGLPLFILAAVALGFLLIRWLQLGRGARRDAS